MKKNLLILVSIGFLLIFINISRANPEKKMIITDTKGSGMFSSVTQNSNSILLYEKFELDIVISKTFNNPYDPDEVDLYCEFWSPSNKYYKQYGFYYKDVYDINPHNNVETTELAFNGTENWKVRFTPNETGQWKYRITLIDKNGVIIKPLPDDLRLVKLEKRIIPTGVVYYKYPGSTSYSYFNCSNSNSKGFIKTANKRYFKYDNGDPYYPVGTNCPHDWYPGEAHDQKGTINTKYFIDEMQNAGLNYFRMEIDYYEAYNVWGYDMSNHKSYYKYFNQIDSWQIDQIVEYAKQKNVNLVFALFSHCNLANMYDTKHWTDNNPSNRNVKYPPLAPDSKGNLSTPYEFFTSNSEIKQQMKYYRYVMARWGYATNLFTVEIMDETQQWYNNIKPAPTEEEFNQSIISWYNNIVPQMRNLDAYDHLLTTAYAGYYHSTEKDVYPLLDITQFHHYWDYDEDRIRNNWPLPLQYYLFDIAQGYKNKYSKPNLYGEFGYLNWRYTSEDPYLYDIHCTNWAMLFSSSQPSAGFWVFQQLLVYDALFNYQGISNFTSILPLWSDTYIPVREYKNGFRLYYLKDAQRNTFHGWIQDYNFNFRNIYDNHPDYLQDLLSDRPPYSSASNTYKVKLNVGQNCKYELKWYSSKTGNLYKKETKTATNKQVELYLWYALRSKEYADGVFSLSCKPSSGWVETQTCEGQWNNVRSDSEVETSSSGNPVFYINSSRQVCALYRSGSTWGDAVLNSLAKKAKSGRGLVFNPLDEAVYYTGEDYKIYRQYYSNGRWYYQKVCSGQWNNVRSDSELETNSSGSHVFYINSNRQVCALYKSGSSWGDAILNSSAKKTKSGRGLIFNSSDGAVYYIGEDYKIYRLYYSNSRWNYQKVCSGQWNNVRSNSELETNSSGSHVFYINYNRQVCALYKSGSIWGDAILNSSARKIKDGTNLTVDKSGTVYYIGDDNYIYKLYYSNGWKYSRVHQADFCQVSALNGIKYNNDRIYYTGVDYKIHDFSYVSNSKNKQNDRAKSEQFDQSKDEQMEEMLSLGKEIFDLEFGFSVFPNPVKRNENLNILLPDSFIDSQVYIYNSSGILLETHDVNSNIVIINTSNLSYGLHIIKVANDKEILRKNIIVAE